MTEKTKAERMADPTDPWYRPSLSDFEQSEHDEAIKAHEIELARQVREQARFDKMSRRAQDLILDPDRNDR